MSAAGLDTDTVMSSANIGGDGDRNPLLGTELGNRGDSIHESEDDQSWGLGAEEPLLSIEGAAAAEAASTRANVRPWKRLHSLIRLPFQHKRSWVLLIFGVILCIAGIGTVFFALSFFGPLSEAIVKGDKPMFIQNFTVMLITVGIFAVIYGLAEYCFLSLSIVTRRVVTQYLTRVYLTDKSYYDVNCVKKVIDNADQRISRDVAAFADDFWQLVWMSAFSFFEIVIGMFMLVTGLGGWIGLLIVLAWVILAYSVSLILSRRVSPWVFSQEKLEGDFRFGHARVRNYAESVAFYNGEAQETRNLQSSFSNVIGNNWSLVRKQFPLDAWSTWILQCGSGVAFLVLGVPVVYGYVHVDKDKLLSDVQGQQQMVQILLQGFSIPLGLVGLFAVVVGTVGRISELLELLDGVLPKDISARHDDDDGDGNDDTDRTAGGATAASGGKKGKSLSLLTEGDSTYGSIPSDSEGNKGSDLTPKCPDRALVAVINATVATPHIPPESPFRVLIRDLNFSVGPGESLLIMGASGAGKSSILRAIAGLWTLRKGHIFKPTDTAGPGGVMFLSQRPYLIEGSLRDQVGYPTANSNRGSRAMMEEELQRVSDADFSRCVRMACLPRFALDDGHADGSRPDIDDDTLSWDDVLSLGEQQRVALARIFYHRPAVAIMDECTSALNVEFETSIYQALRQSGAAFISVGHRPSLKAHHDKILILDGKGGYTIVAGDVKPGGGGVGDVGVASVTDYAPVSEAKPILKPTADLRDSIEEEKEQLGKWVLSTEKGKEEGRARTSIGATFWRRLFALFAITMTGKKQALIWCVLILGFVVDCRTGLLSLYQSKIAADLSASITDINKSGFPQQCALLFGMNAIGSLVLAAELYWIGGLQIRWRDKFTTTIHNAYFRGKAYYKMVFLDKSVDNPDQRTVFDAKRSCQMALSIFFKATNLNNDAPHAFSSVGPMCGVIPSFMSIIISSVYTWMLDVDPSIPIAFASMLCLLGLAINFLLMKPLSSRQWTQGKLEGNFRYSHARIRIYSESIAFYGGEAQEEAHAADRFRAVLQNKESLIRYQAAYTSLANMLYLLAKVFGLAISASAFLFFGSWKKDMSESDRQARMNNIMGVSGPILDGFIGFLTYFAVFAELSGFTNRTMELLAAAKTLGSGWNSVGHVVPVNDTNAIALEDVSVSTPATGEAASRPLIANLSLVLERGGKGLLITGPSGCGKSSLLRTIAGLWPESSGKIYRPTHIGTGGVFFLPQKPYMSVGTLREQITYPVSSGLATQAPIDDTDVSLLLDKCGLPGLVSRVGFDTVVNWEDVLSLGEQQRVAVARLLYHKPAVAFLDECTSALDVDHQENVYREIAKAGISYVSVGHRPELAVFHTQFLRVGLPQQAWTLSDQPPAQPAALV